MSHDHLGLFDTPPQRRQVLFALGATALIAAVLLPLLLPWRDVRLRHVDAFMPLIDAVMFVCDVITAALLFAQAKVFRSRALAVLAAGFVYTAWLLPPHALALPGAITPDGLFGGPSTTAWLGLWRRAVLPVALILYATSKRDAPPSGEALRAPRTLVWGLGAAGMAGATTALLTGAEALLPQLIVNATEFTRAYLFGIESVVLALSTAGAVALFLRRSSVLDLWLLVSLASWVMLSVADMLLHGRFTVGWYWANLVLMGSHFIVMLALIGESNRLYERLALATAARQRERDSRRMSIDAVAAAISHEVGQPLAAMGANATAGLNWLNRADPDVAMAEKSMRAALDAGRKASDVIRSIRSISARGAGRTAELDLNEVVRASVVLLDRELAGARAIVRLDLDEALPPAFGDRVQVSEVVINLLTNAIDSLAATEGRPRRIVIRTAPQGDHDVLLEVADNGAGAVAPEVGNVLEAFLATKATGHGLSLSVCRTLVEAHGGRLWASRGGPFGVTLHVQLPRA